MTVSAPQARSAVASDERPLIGAPAAGGGSPVRIVLGHRFFRSAFVVLVLAGIAVSASIPQLTLYLTRDLGASLPVAGLYYLTNLAAPIAGFLIGSVSDRRENRLTLVRVCIIAGALGWAAMALATSIWMPFVISFFALSIGGAAGGQLFAAARDELSRQSTAADNREFALMPLAARLADRYGGLRVLAVGTVFGVGAYLTYASSSTVVGVSTAQNLYPQGSEPLQACS